MQAYRTMTEIAVRALREKILKGNLKPGTRLIPVKLESELALGRVAIREAIRELSGSGLVESIPNKGTIVAAPPTLDEIKEIYKIRSIIEGKAAIQGTQGVSKEDLSRMETLHQEMTDESLPSPDYFLPNQEFHFILYRSSGWQYLNKLITQLWDHVLAFRSFHHLTQGDTTTFNLEHKQILEAIKSGDSKEVGRLVQKNLQSGLNQILDQMKMKLTELR